MRHALAGLAYFDISHLSPDDLAAIDEDSDAMQIQLTHGGDWHRPMAGVLSGSMSWRRAACGAQIEVVHLQGYSGRGIANTRRSTLEGPLCPTCFTPFELAESARLDTIERHLAAIPDSSNTNNGDD